MKVIVLLLLHCRKGMDGKKRVCVSELICDDARKGPLALAPRMTRLIFLCVTDPLLPIFSHNKSNDDEDDGEEKEEREKEEERPKKLGV